MKGSLHTDELMGAVVSRESGIRTERRISHCFIMDVPGHPTRSSSPTRRSISPPISMRKSTLSRTRSISRTRWAPMQVRVAILSAMETVTAKVPSTIEAAALCKMAERGQITGAVLDGPLALDNAISPEAAAIKKIASPVAGRANILVVPDLEAGNMLAKSLSFLANADAAGIVLGARVPIILTSRADSLISRLASCAVAVMVVANDESIAYGCAKAFRDVGAELAISWRNEKARKHVEPLARELEASIVGEVDVAVTGQLEAMFDQIRSKWGRSTSWCIRSPLRQGRPSGRHSSTVRPKASPSDGRFVPFLRSHG